MRPVQNDHNLKMKSSLSMVKLRNQLLKTSALSYLL